jgi:hypothetical protein
MKGGAREGKEKKRNPNEINAVFKPNEDKAVTLARTALRPTVQAAFTLRDYGNSWGELDLNGLIDSLGEQTKACGDGDLGRAEAMLTAQAHTLDAIFNNLASRAIKAEYLNNLDTYLKLALRSQSQCRATWETLSAIKNPPVMGYVRQANIAHGPQQVNNGVSSEKPRTGENKNQENKLMEQIDGERLDTGTTGATGQADSAMAAVGEIDGAEDKGR